MLKKYSALSKKYLSEGKIFRNLVSHSKYTKILIFESSKNIFLFKEILFPLVLLQFPSKIIQSFLDK